MPPIFLAPFLFVCLIVSFHADAKSLSRDDRVAQLTSSICEFSAGPRAGQRQDYAPRPPIPVGSSCQDGAGSFGTVVAASAPGGQISSICEFSSGPRSGQRQDYAPRPPIPVGSLCQDGVASYGTVVASTPSSGAQLSTVCEFQNGPRAGQRQDYAPMAPISVGSPCHDGFGSNGYVTADSSSTQKSSTCLYYSGPARGHRQYFPNITKVDVGIPCWDGRENFGLSVMDVPNNPYQNSWNGLASAPDFQAPPAASQTVLLPPPSTTPLEIGKQCALSTGANEAAMATCIAHGLPKNTAEQCLGNPASCFGPLSPVTLNVEVAKKVAGIAKINPGNIAKTADKLWNKINPF